MTYRRALIGAAVGATLVAVGGCGSGGSSRAAGDLVIWADGAQLEAVQAAGEVFGKANGITVTVQAIVNTRADFITANQAGNGPDVLVGAHDWIGELVENGSIDHVEIPNAQDFQPIAIDAVSYQGQTWGVPWDVEALVLFCNKEFAPDTYSTFEDVYEVTEAAKSAGKVEHTISLDQGTTGDAYNMQPFFTSGGGYIFKRDKQGDVIPSSLGLGTEASQKAATVIGEWGQKGKGVFSTAINGNNYISLFTSKKAACLIAGPWAIQEVEQGLGKDAYTVQTIPGFAGMDPAQPYMGSQVFYVAKKGKAKLYAEAFVTGTTKGGVNTPESMMLLYQKEGLPPAMTSVRDEVAKTFPQIGIFVDTADKCEPMPKISAMNNVWTPLGEAYAAIITGADPTATMKETAQTVEAAINAP